MVENAVLGRYGASMEAAKKIHAHVGPFVKAMPMADFFSPMPTLVMVRFRRWEEIAKLPQPDAAQADSTGAYHYARALAFAHSGKLEDSKAELEALNLIAPEMAKLPTTPAGPENAGKLPKIMAHIIEAHIARAQKENDKAVKHLEQAIAIEDTLDYNEPPDWFMPARETLGATLLQTGKPAEAERVFRRDLEVNARSPRSLYGLAESLKAQQEDYADWRRGSFRGAWEAVGR